ncbi:hypothetical protein [Paenibacillus sp. FJAT-26967]|uniref:hypothetical protein n=1 Tax=Paenibacillus sp. FJAT-26967 TaxID=1729690 RepID=UPI0008387632|nr:hypothetical protein [Paenibacillus sp. FJAT-26967]
MKKIIFYVFGVFILIALVFYIYNQSQTTITKFNENISIENVRMVSVVHKGKEIEIRDANFISEFLLLLKPSIQLEKKPDDDRWDFFVKIETNKNDESLYLYFRLLTMEEGYFNYNNSEEYYAIDVNDKLKIIKNLEGTGVILFD